MTTEPQSPQTIKLSRAFTESEHFKAIEAQPWRDAVDPHGEVLWGIRGKDGAMGLSMFGRNLGISMIEMRPGAAFGLHVHEGDHILIGISGRGKVHVNEIDYPFAAGDTIFLPGAYPHGVSTFAYEDFTQDELDAGGGLFRFWAIGHPAKVIDARDRMTPVDPATERSLIEQLRAEWGEEA